MRLTNDQITAKNFADFYNKIKPYLNGGGMGMKLLWENSDPTQSFAAGDVTLSSSDYDMLIVMYRMTTSRNYIKSVVIPKSSTAYLDVGYFTSADNQVIYYRTLSSVDDLTVHIYNASKVANSSETMDNSVCIPYRIYGIKVYNRDVQSDYEIIDGTIDSIGANAKKTITLSPTIPTGKKVIGWSMYAVDSDLQTYMQYYGGNYILCVKNIGNNAMTNKDYRVVFIYGQ